MDNAEIIRDFRRRKLIFENYCVANGIRKAICPSCGLPTLNARAVFDYCFICKWEDDGQDDPDADLVFGGPNGSLSLTDSRTRFGASVGNLDPNVSILYKPEKLVPLLLEWSEEFKQNKPVEPSEYVRYLDDFAQKKLEVFSKSTS